MLPLAPATFACDGCSACCRNLASGEPRWPTFFEGLATLGLYALPTRDGLGLASAERRLYLQRGRERGLDIPTRPALAALDTSRDERLVVFAWENDVEACHFIAPDNRCSIYEDRPLACRAYPLRFRQGAVSASPFCHSTFTPPDGDWARAYPDVLPHADAARWLIRETVDHLAKLDANGTLHPVVGASRGWVGRLLAEGRVVDVLDL